MTTTTQMDSTGMLDSLRRMNSALISLLSDENKLRNLPLETKTKFEEMAMQFFQTFEKLPIPGSAEAVASEAEKTRANFEKLLNEVLQEKAPILSTRHP
jgi:hypothetical protein